MDGVRPRHGLEYVNISSISGCVLLRMVEIVCGVDNPKSGVQEFNKEGIHWNWSSLEPCVSSHRSRNNEGIREGTNISEVHAKGGWGDGDV